MPTSARSAVLQARKTPSYKGYRVLSPVDKSISTIQKNVVKAEFDSMISKYNAGQVGNEEMRSFLQKSLSNPILTPQEKVDIQTQLADFDNRVQQDRLEAAYKAAPQNTLEQTQAAQALSSFFKTKANNMQVDTPAYSKAMEAAAEYDQKIVDINNTMQKQQRLNMRYQQEGEINQKPSGSSEQAFDKAKMYNDLYVQATNDGDLTEANRFLSLSKEWATNAGELQLKEATAADKLSIKEFEAKTNLEISRLTDKSPSEIEAKVQKFTSMANMYADMGDAAKYNQYQAYAVQEQEKLSKLYETNSTKAAKADFKYAEEELAKFERAYKYNEPYEALDGTKIDLDGETYLTNKQEILDYLVQFGEGAIDNGVKGLDAKVEKYRNSVEENSMVLEKFKNGQLAETMDKNGKKSFIDTTDPDVAAKYTQGDRFLYPLETQKSTTPGSSGRTAMELQKDLAEGKAYYAKDENGNYIDSQGNILKQDPDLGFIREDTGAVAKPKIIPAQYVDMRTSEGKNERVWEKRDDNGNFLGWIPEGEKLANLDKTYKTPDEWRNMSIPVLPQNVSVDKYVEERNKIATAKPEVNQEMYYGLNEKGLPFSETRDQGVPMPKSDTQPPPRIEQSKSEVQQAQLPAFKPVSQNIQIPQQAFQPSYKEISPGLSSYSAPSYKLPEIKYQDQVTNIQPNQPGLTYSQPVQQQPQKNWWDEPVKKVQNVLGGIGSKIKGFFGW